MSEDLDFKCKNMRKEYTRKQHFVPRAYFRGFSNDTKTVNCIDLNEVNPKNKRVSIKSICFQDNLYEYLGEEDSFQMQNYNENYLGIVEDRFVQYRKALEGRINVMSDSTTSFLSEKEEAYLHFFVAIQAVRMPKVINELTKVVKTVSQHSDKNADEIESRNAALFMSLPFLKDLTKKEFMVTPLGMIVNLLSCMSFSVLYDREYRFFTSDCPLCFFSEDSSIMNCQRAIFPISAQLCVVYWRANEYEHKKHNACYCVLRKELNLIQQEIVSFADRFVYAKNPFRKEFIREHCACKQDDEEKF